jgi:thioredoxin reductase
MSELPTAVIGAGPIGLAAAAHLVERGRPVVLFERGANAGAAVKEWGHVRLFSPWRELIDPAASRLLASTGWVAPDGDRFPTGADWTREYLQPLADALEQADGCVVRYDTEVVGVARAGRDLMVDAGRDDAPFAVHLRTGQGLVVLEVAAVIDASGTWTIPNPLGTEGYPAPGEAETSGHISYRVPDLRDPDVRARYAGKHIALAGTGASAMNVLVELKQLADEHPATRVSWLVRRGTTSTAFGGGENDELVQRGALGQQAREVADTGIVQTLTNFRTTGVSVASDGSLTLASRDGQHVSGVDEVIAVTGFRPDLSFLSEVRLDLDSTLRAPSVLAPLIDPNVHSCGTVYPHGAAELAQPEKGLYLVGMKAYGRAPTFLAMTGFEQVRSVIAELAGDHEAAARVELSLPDTGVCGGAGLFDESGAVAGDGCCGAPAPELLTIGLAPKS